MNRRLSRRAVTASAAGLLATRSLPRAIAQQASPVASPIPEVALTPAGQQLAWIIAVINNEIPLPNDVEMAEHFSALFLDQISAAQIRVLIGQFQRAGAPFTVDGVLGVPTDLAIDLMVTIKDGSQLIVSIVVEEAEPHKIASLLLQPYEAPDIEITNLGRWVDLASVLAASGPNYAISALEVLPTGETLPIHRLNESSFFAIGSVFKFYVLGALALKIELGEVAWDQTVEVTAAGKSFPSGVTQNELDGSEIAVEELAKRMIAISDNTATDMLISLVGRDSCEAALTTMGHSDPSRSLPFLKTKEMFILKVSGDSERLSAYAAGDEPIRREILAAMAGEPLPPAETGLSWTEPIEIASIEWFASMTDLGSAMNWLWTESEKPGLEKIREILTLNPGVPVDSEVWKSVAFKGGSEVGVIALSWRLERVDGRVFTFACAVNNPEAALSDEEIAIAAAGAFALLAGV